MKQVRIAYVIDQLNIGGTENQLLAIIKRLDRKCFEPYLVCLRDTEYMEELSIDCHKKVLGVCSLASWDGVKNLSAFMGFLKKEQIDIVQTFFFDSTVFGVLAARLAKVKCVISCRRDMGFWYRPSLLIALFFVNMMTHRILVNSRAIKDNVHKKELVSRKKIDVIYNGIDLGAFSVSYNVSQIKRELGIPDKNSVVGIVANLNRQVKRVDLFIDAAAKILKKIKNVSFVVVGDGVLRSRLELQAERLGIMENIYFVGSKKNTIPYLQLFNIGVLTSETEGFSNSILEYMAAGLPVVAIDSGGSREVVQSGSNGYLVKLSIDDLSKCLISILNRKEDILDLSLSSLKNVEKYEMNNMVSEISNYYKNIIDNK